MRNSIVLILHLTVHIASCENHNLQFKGTEKKMNHTLIYKYKLSANCTECFERNFDKLQDLLAFADNQMIDA